MGNLHIGLIVRKKYSFLLFFTFFRLTFAYSQPKSEILNLDTLINYGIEAYNEGNYERAISFFEKSVTIATEKNNNKALCKSYNNLGNCYSYLGNLKIALKNYQFALQIAEQLEDSLTVAKCTKNIGTLYSESGDFVKAMTYYDKAEKITLSMKNDFVLADCYNNKAVIYEQEKKYEQALKFYSSALKIYEESKNNERLAMSYNNIGIVYKYEKKYAQAISFYEKSIVLSRQLNDSFLVSANLNNLANVYSLTGNHTKAKQLLLEAIEMAKKIHQSQVLIEALDGISEEYNLLGDSKLAYHYRKEFETEKFNYINTERTKQLADMEVKYETKKKEGEISNLKQQEKIKNLELLQKNESLRKRNLIISFCIIAFLLSVLSGFLFFRFQRIKNLQRETVLVNQTEENERLRLAKDIHDDLGSGLSKIKFLTELVAGKSENNFEIKSNIKSISETAVFLVENMRDLIWALNPENTNLDSLIARIREYSSDYLSDFPIELTVNVSGEVPNKEITKEAHRNIFFILKECLQNIIKHSGASKVNIEVKTEDSLFSLVITDNGKGMKYLIKNGNGLNNMKQRAQIIGSELSFLSENGLQTKLSVPLASIQKKTI